MLPKTKSPSEKSSSRLSTAALLFILALSGIQVDVHNWFVDSRLLDVQQSLHNQVIKGEAPAPIQYRIFVHYLAEGLMKSGLSFKASYDGIRFVFTFLTGVLFYVFVSKWFAAEASLSATFLLFALLPLTYIRYYFQPMDIPNLAFFIAGMLAIRRKNFILFLLILTIAMTNRETAILLVLLYFFVNYGEKPSGLLITETIIAGLIGLGVYFYLRKIYSLKPYYSDMFYLKFNLTDERTYLYTILLIGPSLFYAIKNFNRSPEFLRRALLVLPFFAVIHYTMTIMAEPRLWLPILPLLIPMGMFSLVGENQIIKEETTTTRLDKNKTQQHPLLQKFTLQYIALLCAFMIFFAGFFIWYQKSHLGKRTDYNLSQSILARADALSSGGWNREAAEELERGATLFPSEAEFHYRAGLIYAYRLFDYSEALEHFKKTLELQPHHLDSKRLSAEIERLEYTLSKTKQSSDGKTP